LECVGATGRMLAERLAALPAKWPDVVETSRGVGLMQGFKSIPPNITVWEKLRDHGLLTVPAADNLVRFLPPLNITAQHLDEAMEAVDAACRDLSS
jgi:acetylornithine/N-succinyldiaminopimelate aminotransferase